MNAVRGPESPPRLRDSGGSRRLIVNGDDFGLAPVVNRGILRAHREGILRCASLLVAAPAAAEAVDMARATPTLEVGLHLALVQGQATSARRSIAGLVDGEGRFRNAPIPAGVAFFFRPRLRRAIAVEIRSQLEAFQATGLALSHVDGHLNMHLHPVALDVLADLAFEFRIPAFRLARDPLIGNLRFDPAHAARKTSENAAFRALSRRAERRLAARGVVFADRLFGLHQSGRCDESYLLDVIHRLPRGVSELYAHPAEEHTAELERLMPGYRHGDELAALVSPAVRRAVEDTGLALATWRDLVRG